MVILGISVILAIGAASWFRYKNTLLPAKYNGPVEDIRTGLIGEYATLILIAENKGYFKENGLNVTIKEYPSGPASLADLWKGNLDLAMASEFAGVSDNLNGQDVRILATLSKSEAFFLLARKDHGISEASSLKGKKIGITRKTVGEFFLGQFLSFNSLSPRDIQIIDMPPADLVDALTNGRLDVAVLFEPVAYKANMLLGDKALRLPVQSGQAINSVLHGTSKLSNERPEALKRYMRALVQAEAFVKTHDTEAKDIVARRLNYDDAYIDYIWPNFKFGLSLDQELLIIMDDQARWAIDNKLSPAIKVPNHLHLFDFRPLEAVKPEGITVIR